jgi:ammonium transporter, Amt family
MRSRSWLSQFGPMIALTLAVALPAMLFAADPAVPGAATDAVKTAADAAAAMVPPPPATAAAAPPVAINGADTAWMLVSTALVLMMTPALAFFYGGLTRAKNMLNTMMMSFIAMGAVSIVWAVMGFSIAFGSGSVAEGKYFGDGTFALLAGVGANVWDPAAALIPAVLFMAFQCTFAIITPALISGAIVERMKFMPYVAFIVIWSLVVYSPVCHWVWQANGWLFKLGALDFAGGTVVHINAAVAALVAVMILGRRKDYGKQAILPHNVPFVLLGAAFLWIGWFGFNAGSAVGASSVAAYAFVATFMAPAATLVVWSMLDYFRTGKVTGVGAATAIVVGLVAITPAAGFVTPQSAIVLGAIAAVPSYFAIVYRAKTRLDDSLDVVAAHGLGGVTGALLTAVFATNEVNSLIPKEGYSIGTQLGIQAVAIVATIAYSAIMTAIILSALKATFGLIATDKEQGTGMDITQHGEEAYANGEGAILVLPDEIKSSSSTVSTQVAGAKA